MLTTSPTTGSSKTIAPIPLVAPTGPSINPEGESSQQILKELEQTFASSSETVLMTSKNEPGYRGYSGYSEETPIAPGQRVFSIFYLFVLSLVAVALALSMALQRWKCHPLLSALAGSVSWYELEHKNANISALIEELMPRTAGPVDGSQYWRHEFCLMNVRPLSWLSFFALGFALWVFLYQHQHLFPGHDMMTVFCDTRPHVASTRWIWITGTILFTVCMVMHCVTAIAMVDPAFFVSIIGFIVVCLGYKREISGYHVLWYTGGNAVAVIMILCMSFLCSCMLRSWSALQYTLDDLLLAIQKTNNMGFTQVSVVNATACLHPDFFATQHLFTSACALCWVLVASVTYFLATVRHQTDASAASFSALLRFEIGLWDLVSSVIVPIALMVPLIARVFNHGGVLSVFPNQFWLWVFDECAVAGGIVWCGDDSVWSSEKALQLLSGTSTTSYLDWRQRSNWFVYVLIGYRVFVPLIVEAIFLTYTRFVLIRRRKSQVEGALEVFWRHRKAFGGVDDFLPLSKELGGQIIRTNIFHLNMSFLHSLPKQKAAVYDISKVRLVKDLHWFDKYSRINKYVNKFYPGRIIDRQALVTVTRYLLRRVHEANRPERKRVLRRVVGVLVAPHKTIYESAWRGIQLQPMYHSFLNLADELQGVLGTIYGPNFKPRHYDVATSHGAKTLRDLYNSGIAAFDNFTSMLHTLGKKTGGKARVAPMKSLYRVMEKITLLPGALEMWKRASTLTPEDVDAAVQKHAPCDIVRGWIEFSNISQMKLGLGLLIGADERLQKVRGFLHANTTGLGFRLEIMRIKNRFRTPTAGGWADMQLNFRFQMDANTGADGVGDDEKLRSAYWHVCEIQFIHKHMSLVRRQMGAHHMYAKYRSATELLEALDE